MHLVPSSTHVQRGKHRIVRRRVWSITSDHTTGSRVIREVVEIASILTKVIVVVITRLTGQDREGRITKGKQAPVVRIAGIVQKNTLIRNRLGKSDPLLQKK